MNLFEAAARALVLGLSTGLLCLGSCAPVLLPVLLAEERKGAAARWAPFLQFVAGRLVAYLTVGLAAGAAGGLAAGGRWPRGLAGIAYLGIGLMMIVFGLVRGFPRLRLCRRLGPLLNRARAPLILGLLVGFNLCPPFLAALADVVAVGRPGYGLVFFAVFFLVTTVFLLPLAGAGGLARDAVLRAIAQLAAVIAGVMYLSLGLVRILG
jgi:sulfite exporter TauE/SafE